MSETNGNGAQKARKLTELPEHVQKFLAELKEEDVKSFESAMDFFKWFKTTGRFTRVIIVTGFSVFGAMVAAAQGWDYVVAKLFAGR